MERDCDKEEISMAEWHAWVSVWVEHHPGNVFRVSTVVPMAGPHSINSGVLWKLAVALFMARCPVDRDGQLQGS